MTQTFVLVRYSTQPGMAATALEHIKKLVATVLATERSCAGIDVLQDIDMPERITLVERWPDRETFLGPHMQQPHINEFIQSAGAFLAGPPEITFHAAQGAT